MVLHEEEDRTLQGLLNSTVLLLEPPLIQSRILSEDRVRILFSSIAGRARTANACERPSVELTR